MVIESTDSRRGDSENDVYNIDNIDDDDMRNMMVMAMTMAMMIVMMIKISL